MDTLQWLFVIFETIVTALQADWNHAFLRDGLLARQEHLCHKGFWKLWVKMHWTWAMDRLPNKMQPCCFPGAAIWTSCHMCFGCQPTSVSKAEPPLAGAEA